MIDQDRRWISPNDEKWSPGFTPTDLNHVAPPRISTIVHPELFIIDGWLKDIVMSKFATEAPFDVLTGISLLASLWHLPEREDADSIKAKLERAKDTGWAPRARAVSWFRGVSLRARNTAEEHAIAKCEELISALVDLEDSIAEGGSDVSEKTLSWLHGRDDIKRVSDLFAWAKYSVPNLDAAIKELDTESFRYRRMWSFIEGLGNDKRLVDVGLRDQGTWWGDMASRAWIEKSRQ